MLVFEDLHWADAALLDFVEYLLDWSRNHPLFILTLARPELVERRPTWGAGKRNFHSLVLEPLPEEARDELLLGLVPGLPDDLARSDPRSRGRSSAVCDRDGSHAARPWGARPRERRLPAVPVPSTRSRSPRRSMRSSPHGSTASTLRSGDSWRTPPCSGRRSRPALSSVAGRRGSDLEPLLASLVRKEILTVEADPRSPERGQYGFLHALVQKVAYDTLGRKERKTRHLAAAAYLEAGTDPDEIAEVIASHYLEAYRAAPDVADAAGIKAQACERLARAGERAASLAATGEAERYFTTAAELADEPRFQAAMRERAGITARAGAAGDRAASHLEESIRLFEAAGHTHDAARVSARLADTMWDQRHAAEAVQLMERSFEILSRTRPTPTSQCLRISSAGYSTLSASTSSRANGSSSPSRSPRASG